MDEFIIGKDDIYRQILLIDEDGNPFDTDDFLTISIKVTHEKRQNNIGSYSLAAASVVQIAPNANGYVYFIVPVADQLDSNTGIYEYQVDTTETDADYPGSIRNRSFRGDCFRLKYSL